MSILKSSIKVSVTFGVSDTFKVAVFPASTFKEYTVVSTLYPNGADNSLIYTVVALTSATSVFPLSSVVRVAICLVQSLSEKTP